MPPGLLHPCGWLRMPHSTRHLTPGGRYLKATFLDILHSCRCFALSSSHCLGFDHETRHGLYKLVLAVYLSFSVPDKPLHCRLSCRNEFLNAREGKPRLLLSSAACATSKGACAKCCKQVKNIIEKDAEQEEAERRRLEEVRARTREQIQ